MNFGEYSRRNNNPNNEESDGVFTDASWAQELSEIEANVRYTSIKANG